MINTGLTDGEDPENVETEDLRHPTDFFMSHTQNRGFHRNFKVLYGVVLPSFDVSHPRPLSDGPNPGPKW